MSWDQKKAFTEAEHSVKTLIIRLASDAGAEIRERPAWPGAAVSSVREPEPVTGLLAALSAQQAARAAVLSYVAAARGDGLTWDQIGQALRQPGGIGDDLLDDSPYFVAVAAFEYVAGPIEAFCEPTFAWRCRACGRRITDRGPYDGHPLNSQSGHSAGCARLAAEAVEFEAAWRSA